MLAKALKSFRGQYGLIRAGTTFNCDPPYFAALKKNGLVEEADGKVAAGPGPSDNRAIPRAPGHKGKVQPGQPANKPGASVAPPAGGKTLTSSSLRADLASREKTSKKSAAGAKAKTKPKSTRTRVVLDKEAPPPDA